MSSESVENHSEARRDVSESFAIRFVALTGCVLCFCFAAIFMMSGPFEYGNQIDRPIRLFAGLFFAATLLSLLSIRCGLKIRERKRALAGIIILFAISYRVLMIFTTPILEVDLYRYMWDGKVMNAGVSPFKYSPAQALAADLQIDNADYKTIVALTSQTETLNSIVSRVHFKEYSTIYPPVSQAVFAIVMKLVPNQASVQAHLFSIKATLVLFDIGTLALVLVLLNITRMHPAWLIAYAWNPLVVKEIANGGHLDSIAVFFATASICCIVIFSLRAKTETAGTENRRRFFGRSALIGTGALMLALGTGAKLFPVVLFPAMLLAVAKSGWRHALLFGSLFLVMTTMIMWPMAARNPIVQKLIAGDRSPLEQTQTDVAQNTIKINPTQPKDGLSGFLTHWRINDVVFSFVYDNARPDSGRTKDVAWYVIIPNQTRQAWYNWLERFDGFAGNPAFLTARMVTLFLFGSIYVVILFRIRTDQDAQAMLESFFLILASFFLLLPTQNPWYWLWAMPLVCFARNRGWLFVSAFLFIYYLRFWFDKLEGEYKLGDFVYSGLGLFDYAVAWLELGAILGTLLCFKIVHRRSDKA